MINQSFNIANQETELANGLVVKYEFPNNYNDTSGNSINATGSNTTFVADKYNAPQEAVNFVAASNSYVNVPDDDRLSFTDGVNDLDFSIYVRVKFDSFGAGLGGLLSKGTTNANAEYIIVVNDSGQLYFGLYGDNDTAKRLFFTPSRMLTTGVYYDIVAIHDSGVLSVYINAAPQLGTAGNVGYTKMINSTSILTIGNALIGSASQRKSDSNIDDCWIYNRVITLAQIRALYARPPIN